MICYVDESVHIDHGLYIIAAAIVEGADDARADLLALKPAGAPRLHWQSNSQRLRESSADLVAIHVEHAYAFVAYFDDKKRQDLARATIFEQILSKMGGPPITELVIDQRNGHQNARDKEVLLKQCRRLNLRHPPRWSHGDSRQEPLLWLPDTIAGAVGQHLLWKDPAMVHRIGAKLQIP